MKGIHDQQCMNFSTLYELKHGRRFATNFVVNMLYNTVENYPPSQVNQHKELFYIEKCLM